MDYTFATLTPSDTTVLQELLRVFGQAFEDVETYQGAIPSAAYLRSLLATPTFIVVVARHGDTVVGGLAAYELRKFERERSEIYIYDLAVAQEHRRRGVASIFGYSSATSWLVWSPCRCACSTWVVS